MKIKLLYTFGAIALGLFSTSSFSQTTPFIPQVKDWGTYLPSLTTIYNTPSTNLVPLNLNNRNDLILTWIVNENDENLELINNWMTANSHQSITAGINDALLCSFSEDGTLNWATYLGGEKEELKASVYMSGFNVYSNFSKSFKKKFLYSPSTLKRGI